MDEIPSELKERIPLLKKEHLSLYKKISEHQNAPNWNYYCGDRLTSDDLPFLEIFEDRLKNNRNNGELPSEEVLNNIKEYKNNSYFFEKSLKFINIEKQFFLIPVTTRQNLSEDLSMILPHTADLNRLVINPTSGTTGHSIPCPNHPKSIGCYNPLIKYSIEKNGGDIKFIKDSMAAIQVYFQKETAVYSTVKPVLNGAGFAKINLNPDTWRTEICSEIFINEMNPILFTGNPIGFSELLNKDIKVNIKGFLSTSLYLNPILRKNLENKFKAPVVNFYSLNDTGPLGYSCPTHKDEFHVLPHDIYLEITDEEGNHLREGEDGFITVSGGRNPYIPLVRYQTGDKGSISYGKCDCGEITPRFILSDSRLPVMFKTKSGSIINPIDINRIIRRFPILQHQFIQKDIDKCILSINPMPIFSNNDLKIIEEDILELFNKEIVIASELNLKGNEKSGKVIPYINELENKI